MATITDLLRIVRERYQEAHAPGHGIRNSLARRYYAAKSQQDIPPMHDALSAVVNYSARTLVVGSKSEWDRGHDAAVTNILKQVADQLGADQP